MKICQKNGCDEIAISRGKYCEKHRTGLKKNDISSTRPRYNSVSSPIENISIRSRNNNISTSIESKSNISSVRSYLEDNIEEAIRLSKLSFEEETKTKLQEVNKKIEEDRVLKIEQEKEFLETLQKDKERIELETKKRIEEENRKQDILRAKEKFKKWKEDNNSEYYKIKIKLSSTNIIGIFSNEAIIKDIRDFINIYLDENNINIKNYDLLNVNPNKRFTIKDNNLEIRDINVSKNFCLFLENLDS